MELGIRIRVRVRVCVEGITELFPFEKMRLKFVLMIISDQNTHFLRSCDPEHHCNTEFHLINLGFLTGTVTESFRKSLS